MSSNVCILDYGLQALTRNAEVVVQQHYSVQAIGHLSWDLNFTIRVLTFVYVFENISLEWNREIGWRLVPSFFITAFSHP